jgi:hypothetical protein
MKSFSVAALLAIPLAASGKPRISLLLNNER